MNAPTPERSTLPNLSFSKEHPLTLLDLNGAGAARPGWALSGIFFKPGVELGVAGVALLRLCPFQAEEVAEKDVHSDGRARRASPLTRGLFRPSITSYWPTQ